MKHFQRETVTALFVTGALAATLIAIWCIEQLVSAALGGVH